jgi:hypothetical protein
MTDPFKVAEEMTEQWAFETFATTYPHEAHAEWPERFWEFFQHNRPGVSREDMERIMAETEEA